MNDPYITAIILAAGESARMGSPKALLKIEDKNFIDIIREKLMEAGISDICLVLGAGAGDVKSNLNTDGLNIKINENWEKGQLSSLKTGLKGVSDQANAVMMCLIDHPQVQLETIKKLIVGFMDTKADIVIPQYQERGGHPVIYNKTVFKALMEAPLDKGARVIAKDSQYNILKVDVDDPYIRQDIDTPEEYNQIGRSRQNN
ncbi:NTP transferase domain-containing protein [Elusimicrobiota bacterium]